MTMTSPGLTFIVETDGRVAMKSTKRADLARSRLGAEGRRVADVARLHRLAERQGRQISASFAPSILGVVNTPTADFAAKLARVLTRLFCKSGSQGFPRDKVNEALWRCNEFGLSAASLDTPVLRAKFVDPVRVTQRYVPDPSMSKAELLHQLEQNPKRRRVGQLRADVNETTRIGGLARLKVGLSEAQKQGAAHFRTVAEKAQIGGARAIDYAAVRVDTSGPTEGAVFEIGEDARREYSAALDALGADRFEIADRIIVQSESISSVALTLHGPGGAGRDKVTGEAIEATTALAELYGYLGQRKGKAKVSGWTDGTTAGIVRQDVDKSGSSER